MLTKDELSALLRGVNAAEVAREADVALKTIYRLRHQKNSPTLDMVEKLVSAVRKVKARQAA